MTARGALLAAAAAAVAVDFASKAAAVRYLTGNPIDVGGLLTLRVIYNPGVAFGVGASAPAPLIIALTGLAVAGLAVMAWRGGMHPPVAAGLVVGGGVANLGDRLTGGSVVDLFDLGWWPVFNLADVLLLTGVGVILLSTRRQRPPVGAAGPRDGGITPRARQEG